MIIRDVLTVEQRSVLSVEAAEKSAAMTVLTGLSATGAAPVAGRRVVRCGRRGPVLRLLGQRRVAARADPLHAALRDDHHLGRGRTEAASAEGDRQAVPAWGG